MLIDPGKINARYESINPRLFTVIKVGIIPPLKTSVNDKIARMTLLPIRSFLEREYASVTVSTMDSSVPVSVINTVFKNALGSVTDEKMYL